MASEKILKEKQQVIDEIKENVTNAKSVVLFDYRGITDEDSKYLRRKLKDVDANYKIYKNTLMARAFSDLDIDLKDNLNGPSAFLYGNDQISPVKVLTDFAKDHKDVNIKIGIIDNEIADQAKLNKYASLPSREGLLTMLAGAMIAIPRDLSICLDLYAKQLEEK